MSFEAKIWTRKREFTADIETQRPNERIKWSVSQGLNHTGVVTFHELGPKLTRVLVGFDLQPGGFIEKIARGGRHVKRAARADLHRFKAFIETAEQETGAWRGVIEDGELVEEHDPSYDEQREYSDIEQLTQQQDSEDEAKDEQEGDEQEGRGRKSRDSGDKRSRQSARQSDSRGRSRSSSGSSRSSGSGSSRSASGSSGSSRSASGSSRSGSRSRSSRQSSNGRSSGNSRSSGRGQQSQRSKR